MKKRKNKMKRIREIARTCSGLYPKSFCFINCNCLCIINTPIINTTEAQNCTTTKPLRVKVAKKPLLEDGFNASVGENFDKNKAG